MNPATDTAITLGEELGDDIAKVAQNIMQEREPIRHARMMHRLYVFLENQCRKNNTTPETEIAADLSELPAAQQQIIAAVVRDRMGLPQLAQQEQPAQSGNETKTSPNTSKQNLVPDDEGNLVDAVTGLYPKDAQGNNIIKKA